MIAEIPIKAQSRLAGLDGLRGLCAFGVLAFHAEFLTGVQIAPSAYLAVDMFFMISGYVLARAYEEKLRTGGYLRVFVVRRYARVLPMWLIGMAFGLMAAAPGAIHARTPLPIAGEAFLAAAIVPCPWTSLLFPLNTPGWSLFLELLVNFAWAAIGFRLRTSALVTVVLLLLVLLVVTVVRHGSAHTGFDWMTLSGGLIRSAFGFLVGVLLYRLHWRICPFGSVSAVLLLSVVTAVLFVRVSPAWRASFDVFMITVLFPIAVFGLGTATAPVPRLCEWLGAVSYPLYAIHFGFFLLARTAVGLVWGWDRLILPAVQAAAIAGAAVSLALILGLWLDPAMQRRIVLRLNARPTQVPSGR